jgi:predicted alpha/beta-hydrolase family hydrolase
VSTVNAVPFDVDVGPAKTGALLYRARDPRGAIVLAHGAGGRQSHPWMVGAAEVLARRGLDVVTFDFLYTHAGKRVPDKNDKLEATWRAVIEAVRAREDVAHARFFIGGKSMGGRIATQVAAAEDTGEITGLALLGYPLHPPGKPERRRAAHLPGVRAPMLFVQGSRDAFGTPDELSPVVASLSAGSRLIVVEGGDHSLAVGREPLEKTIARVCDAVARFCEDVSPLERSGPINDTEKRSL